MLIPIISEGAENGGLSRLQIRERFGSNFLEGSWQHISKFLKVAKQFLPWIFFFYPKERVIDMCRM